LNFSLDVRGLLRYKNYILQRCARGHRFRAFSFLRRGGLFNIMTKASKTAAAAERARRNAMICDGVRAGHAAPRIAQDLAAVGFTPPSQRRLQQIMRDSRTRGVEPLSKDFLTTELKRLEELQEALHAKALAGDNAAVDRSLVVLDRRAKLLGVGALPPAPPESSALDARELLLRKLESMAERLSRPKATGNESQ
jgi:hypothetical protein